MATLLIFIMKRKKNSIAYLDSEFRLSSPSKKKIKINSYKVYISACRTGTKDATARASLKYYNPKGEVLYGRVNDVTTQYSVCEYNIGVWKNVIIDSFEDSYAAHIIIYSTAIKIMIKMTTSKYVLLKYTPFWTMKKSPTLKLALAFS